MQVKVNECGVPRSLLLSSIMQEPGSCHRSLCKDALCCQEDPSADNVTNTVCNFKTVFSNPFYQSVRIYTCITLSYGAITWSLSNSAVFHILIFVIQCFCHIAFCHIVFSYLFASSCKFVFLALFFT